MKRESASQEELIKQVQKLLEERGRKALEMARETILQEEVECKEVCEALNYFMTEYWHDTTRPALLSLACEAVGGDPKITTQMAAGMTLISGATDIHDDLIDQSEIKESRPTVLGKFGKEVALLVGDALLFKGFALVYKAIEKGISVGKIATIIDVIKKMFFEMGDAEALELQFRGRTEVPPENYLHVTRKKAADAEACTRIGAILGGGSEKEISALGKYGRLLGMIFILRDDSTDIVDLVEIQHRFEKECLPLPVLFALQDSGATDKITAILLKDTVTKKDVKTILEIIRDTGGLQKYKKVMRTLAKEAHANLNNINRNNRYLEMLVEAIILPLDLIYQ